MKEMIYKGTEKWLVQRKHAVVLERQKGLGPRPGLP